MSKEQDEKAHVRYTMKKYNEGAQCETVCASAVHMHVCIRGVCVSLCACVCVSMCVYVSMCVCG